MKVSILAVTTAAAVLLLVSTPIQGNGNALKLWIDAEKTCIVFPLEQELNGKSAYSEQTPVESSNKIIFIKQTKAIKAGVVLDDQRCLLTAFVGNSELEVSPDHQSATNYLPWRKNKATALLLNRLWGDMFLTARLSGCEVWIAYRRQYEPLIVHINAEATSNAVSKLRYMEDLAFQVLNYFNKHIQKQEDRFYQFKRRICYNYDEEEDAEYSSREMDKYWDEFNEKNIAVNKYVGNSLFYGSYSSGTWKFSLKNIDSGKQVNVVCENSRGICTIS